MTAVQILVDGFTLSALYALGATGFTLIFGVSGVLNLAHGALMVAAAVAAWAATTYWNVGVFGGALFGVLVCLVLALATYALIVRPLMTSRRLPASEKEVFILTATLLWAIMVQEVIAYFFSNNDRSVPQFTQGMVEILGYRTPLNKVLEAAICWLAIGILWLLVNRTKAGKAVLAASMNPRGVTLLGIELSWIYIAVWTIYGLLAGLAGVLLGQYFAIGSEKIGALTASAFSVVVLGGLGSVTGSLIAAYAVGYLETATATLISDNYRTIPSLLLLVVVIYVRPRGLFGRR